MNLYFFLWMICLWVISFWPICEEIFLFSFTSFISSIQCIWFWSICLIVLFEFSLIGCELTIIREEFVSGLDRFIRERKVTRELFLSISLMQFNDAILSCVIEGIKWWLNGFAVSKVFIPAHKLERTFFAILWHMCALTAKIIILLQRLRIFM